MEAICPVFYVVGRLLCSGRQADEMLAVYKFLKFDNFNSKARLGCFNGFMAPIALYFVPIDEWPVIEGNVIVRLFLSH